MMFKVKTHQIRGRSDSSASSEVEQQLRDEGELGLVLAKVLVNGSGDVQGMVKGSRHRDEGRWRVLELSRMGDFDDSCLGDGSSGNPRSSLGDARGSLGEATTLRVENKGTLGKGGQEDDAYEIVGDVMGGQEGGIHGTRDDTTVAR
ncbi:unnamed protein product, partial [Ilex paraguariensis]